MEPLTGKVLNINNEYGSYQEYKAAVDTELQRSAESFVRIGYLLKVARDTDILKESGYGSVNEFAEKEYGLDKSQVSRFIRINDEYSENGYSDRLQDKYRDFGHAKLAMMLTLPAAVSEELTASYTKAEIGMIKEEIEAERSVSDLEVMMEEKNQQQEEYGIVGKVLHQLGHDDPELHIKLYDVVRNTELKVEDGKIQIGPLVNGLAEALAPSGEAIHSVRIAGEGRKLLSIKGTESNPVIIDVRSGDKEDIRWDDFLEEAEQLYCTTVAGKEGWEQLYGEPFPANEEPKNAPVAPVQPKNAKKVTKAKVKKPAKPHKDQEEDSIKQEENHDTEEPQTIRDSDNEAPAAVNDKESVETTDSDQHEPEPTNPAHGTGGGDGTADMGDDTDTGNEPTAAGDDGASGEVSRSELVNRIEIAWNKLFAAVQETMGFDCMNKDDMRTIYSKTIDMAAAIEQLMNSADLATPGEEEGDNE